MKTGVEKKNDAICPISNSQQVHVTLDDAELAVFRTRVCEQHQSGYCKDSERCPHSHCRTWQRRSPAEYFYLPNLCSGIKFIKRQKKMTLVRRCSLGKTCTFSHSKEEELYHPNIYKTKICNFHPYCTRYYCPFAHTTKELRKPDNWFLLDPASSISFTKKIDSFKKRTTENTTKPIQIKRGVTGTTSFDEKLKSLSSDKNFCCISKSETNLNYLENKRENNNLMLKLMKLIDLLLQDKSMICNAFWKLVENKNTSFQELIIHEKSCNLKTCSRFLNYLQNLPYEQVLEVLSILSYYSFGKCNKKKKEHICKTTPNDLLLKYELLLQSISNEQSCFQEPAQKKNCSTLLKNSNTLCNSKSNILKPQEKEKLSAVRDLEDKKLNMLTALKDKLETVVSAPVNNLSLDGLKRNEKSQRAAKEDCHYNNSFNLDNVQKNEEKALLDEGGLTEINNNQFNNRTEYMMSNYCNDSDNKKSMFIVGYHNDTQDNNLNEFLIQSITALSTQLRNNQKEEFESSTSTLATTASTVSSKADSQLDYNLGCCYKSMNKQENQTVLHTTDFEKYVYKSMHCPQTNYGVDENVSEKERRFFPTTDIILEETKTCMNLNKESMSMLPKGETFEHNQEVSNNKKNTVKKKDFLLMNESEENDYVAVMFNDNHNMSHDVPLSLEMQTLYKQESEQRDYLKPAFNVTDSELNKVSKGVESSHTYFREDKVFNGHTKYSVDSNNKTAINSKKDFFVDKSKREFMKSGSSCLCMINDFEEPKKTSSVPLEFSFFEPPLKRTLLQYNEFDDFQENDAEKLNDNEYQFIQDRDNVCSTNQTTDRDGRSSINANSEAVDNGFMVDNDTYYNHFKVWEEHNNYNSNPNTEVSKRMATTLNTDKNLDVLKTLNSLTKFFNNDVETTTSYVEECGKSSSGSLMLRNESYLNRDSFLNVSAEKTFIKDKKNRLSDCTFASNSKYCNNSEILPEDIISNKLISNSVDSDTSKDEYIIKSNVSDMSMQKCCMFNYPEIVYEGRPMIDNKLNTKVTIGRVTSRDKLASSSFCLHQNGLKTYPDEMIGLDFNNNFQKDIFSKVEASLSTKEKESLNYEMMGAQNTGKLNEFSSNVVIKQEENYYDYLLHLDQSTCSIRSTEYNGYMVDNRDYLTSLCVLNGKSRTTNANYCDQSNNLECLKNQSYTESLLKNVSKEYFTNNNGSKNRFDIIDNDEQDHIDRNVLLVDGGEHMMIADTQVNYEEYGNCCNNLIEQEAEKKKGTNYGEWLTSTMRSLTLEERLNVTHEDEDLLLNGLRKNKFYSLLQSENTIAAELSAEVEFYNGQQQQLKGSNMFSENNMMQQDYSFTNQSIISDNIELNGTSPLFFSSVDLPLKSLEDFELASERDGVTKTLLRRQSTRQDGLSTTSTRSSSLDQQRSNNNFSTYKNSRVHKCNNILTNKNYSNELLDGSITNECNNSQTDVF